MSERVEFGLYKLFKVCAFSENLFFFFNIPSIFNQVSCVCFIEILLFVVTAVIYFKDFLFLSIAVT
jgi:hypothetical protein